MMTNSENTIYGGRNFGKTYTEMKRLVRENDKLKADVEQFSNELISVRIENELLKKKNELTNHYFEQYSAAIDEIEKLKEELHQLTHRNCLQCFNYGKCSINDNFNITNCSDFKLKSEVSE